MDRLESTKSIGRCEPQYDEERRELRPGSGLRQQGSCFGHDSVWLWPL